MSYERRLIKHEISKLIIVHEIKDISNVNIEEVVKSDPIPIIGELRAFHLAIYRKEETIDCYLAIEDIDEEASQSPISVVFTINCYVNSKIVKSLTSYGKISIYSNNEYLREISTKEIIDGGNEVSFECVVHYSLDAIKLKHLKNLIALTEVKQHLTLPIDDLGKENVTILVGTHKIKTNRKILAEASKYFFRAMFEDANIAKIRSDIILVADVKYEIMKEIIECLQHGRDPSDEHLLDCLKAADNYELLDFHLECQRMCFKHVHSENIFETLKTADECNAIQLKAVIFDILEENQQLFFKSATDIAHQLPHNLLAEMTFHWNFEDEE